MLGKQWLNIYAATDVRGSAAQRSQNRQQKFDALVEWRFGYLMELLPLMLQAGLFLLCLALARYFWEIDTTAAYVVIGVTSIGIVLYIAIIGAAAVFTSCPYRTPGSRLTRFLCCSTTLITRIAIELISAQVMVLVRYHSWFWKSYTSIQQPKPFAFNQELKTVITQFLLIVIETYDLGIDLGLISVQDFIIALQVYYSWRVPPVTERGLDLRCASWMIRESLDKAVRTSALKYLQTITRSPYFEPSTITGCFNVFISCINISGRDVAIVQGSEELATLSATCFLRTILGHPASPAYTYRPALEEVRQHYKQTFPHPPDFGTLPVCYTMTIIHYRLSNQRYRKVSWRDCRSSSRDHPFVAQTLAEFAKPPKQRGRPKVPRWILRFALHSLSLDPLPPTSVIADCLSIVATDIGCSSVPNTGTTPDERCVCIRQLDVTLTSSQCMFGAGYGLDNPKARRDDHGRGFTTAPFRAQGDHSTLPLRGLAGARRATRDACTILACYQSLEFYWVPVASRPTVRQYTAQQGRSSHDLTCIAPCTLG